MNQHQKINQPCCFWAPVERLVSNSPIDVPPFPRCTHQILLNIEPQNQELQAALRTPQAGPQHFFCGKEVKPPRNSLAQDASLASAKGSKTKSPDVMPYSIRLHVRCFAPVNIPTYSPEISDSWQVCAENVGTVFDDAPAAFRQSECPTPALGRRKLAAHF